jgi:hypothetical protein
MTSLAGRRRFRQALVAGVILAVFTAIVCGGLVVSNAWAIGHSIGEQPEPSTSVPPVAHRRWYARAVFFAPDSAGSPVPYLDDNGARD